MSISPGARLGPYEILAPIGAGGMGEVWRARDPRLGRDVAIKVLPASFSADADRLRRFEQEAKAAGLLNHPNITIVYDIGQADGAPYVVQELLEGETLRQTLAGGKLSARKAIDYAIQIAHGLAAAHEKGIVHRDLKPENLFVTRDGRVKILDFGLAKLTHAEEAGSGATNLPTATAGTEPGVVLGTLGYMSPEQVRGRSADARSDIFSFGAILYEMLAGQRAFRGDSAADMMSAILKEDPPDISVTNQNVPPGLERIVRHCLEKNPEQRFHSAHDLAFDLEALSGTSAAGSTTASYPPSIRRPRFAAAAIAVALLAALAAGALLASLKKNAPPRFKQITFRRGTIVSARFAPDGQTIVYGAAWDGRPFEVFSTRSEGTTSRSLGLPAADVLAVSSSGQMAISLGRRFTTPYVALGTLAESPLEGGAPRELLENVLWADWSPDGKLAVVRDAGGRNRLEFPVGKVLYETSGHVSHPRFSPRGDLIAFLNHPSRGSDLGTVAVIDPQGKKKDLSGGWDSLWGLAWSPKGDEVWFTASRVGALRALYAVSPSGRERVVERIAGQLTLADVNRDGRALLLNDQHRLGMIGVSAGDPAARDLTYLDYSAARDLSADGTRLLFDEPGGGGGPASSVYLRKMDGSPPVRLGDGFSMALSPDAAWTLSSPASDADRLVQFVLLPTGVGEPRRLPTSAGALLWADWLPTGKEILYTAAEPGKGARLYLQDVSSGRIRPISDYGVTLLFYSHLISPDSRVVAARGPDQKMHLYPLGPGEVREIPGLAAGEEPIRWNADGRFLYVYRPGELPARISKLEVATGRREPWRDLIPPDSAGVVSIRPPVITADGAVCVYSYSRFVAELFVVEGLR